MINLNSSSNKTLNIILANTNKALNEVLKDISPHDLEVISKAKDLKGLLESILQKSTTNPAQDKALLELLKNNPTLKELANVSTTLKEFQNLLKADKDPLTVKLKELITQSLSDIKTIDEKSLKTKLQNSGVFLEAKLKDSAILKDVFSNDLKAVLQKAHAAIASSSHPLKNDLIQHIDKLSLQIDYYQLLSHLSNASAIYLPYSFDALEDANVTIKNAKNSKFFCDIELKLKEYGELKLRLGLFEKNNLNMDVVCQSQELKNLLKENISELKKQLFEANIYPKDIRFLDDKKNDTYYEDKQDIELGFEVKA